MPLRSRTRTVCPSKVTRPVVALATKDVEAWSTRADRARERRRRALLGRPGGRPDPFEDDAGCPQLRVRPASIALGAVRLGQPHAGDRRLVRCADFVPETRRLFEVPFCIRGGAFGEPDPPVGEGGAGRQRLALEPVGHAPPAPRRPLGPAPGRRPRPRSRPAPRAAAPDEARCSEAAPSTAPASDSRAHPGWRRPPTPRPLGPAARGPGRVVDPIRRGELRARPPPRRGCRPVRSRIRPSSLNGQPSSRRR